jgi:ATP-dependent DNA helicase RecQ
MEGVAQKNLKEHLQEYFGFKKFKGEQEAVVKSLLSGKDTFVIMPTGGGKSLCYQLPALISEGTAIVISPLIALMKNQVDLIRGYASNDSIAHFLNSSLNKTQQNQVKRDILAGETKLLYVAPETLTKKENLKFFAEINVSFVAVDEAHCISEWGHDFRPEYRRIREMIVSIDQEVPVIALTATATPKVQEDIVKTLKLDDPNIFISSFNRSNLFYEIRPKRNDASTVKSILQFVTKHKDESGIVYVTNRKKAEEIAEALAVNGIKAAPYHAGIENKIRSQTQDAFLMEDLQVIVATIAFGMGIDKPDIRFIIHYDIAKSLENYYQETGRGGRDGLEGHCLGFFSYKDITKIEKLMRDKSLTERERGGQLLDEMVAYCETSECRRKFILHYFGEYFDDDNCVGMCDNCKHPRQKVDVSKQTEVALKLIDQMGQKFAIPHLVNVLTGKQSKDVKAYGHDKLELFGFGKDSDTHYWNSILRHALMNNLAEKKIEKNGAVELTDNGYAFLKKPVPVKVAINHNFEEEMEEEMAASSNRKAVLDETLLNMLRDLRKKVSSEVNLPPYVIFQDSSLEEMATRYPISSDEFANITGVSKGKALRYGKRFSDVIRKYVEENDIERPEDMVVKSVVNKSGNKVKIIQSIDKRMMIEDIADNLRISKQEAIDEIESIVRAGTKVNIDYQIDNIMEEDLRDDIMDFFREDETGSLQNAYEEFQDDGLEMEDLQLVRIKFISDAGN